MSANKILVPIGFSEQSILALGQACNLAKIKNSDIVLLSVIQEQSMIQLLYSKENSEELRDKVKSRLNELANEFGNKYSVSVETMVSKGKIYDQINKVSELISADLIVMGTNGSQGRSSKLIGSNAEKVVRLSRCPVITIKGKANRDGCKNIILPLDLARKTKEKVTHALEYARYWNSTIHIVSAVLREDEDIRAKLNKNINQVHDFIRNAGVKCTSGLIESKKKQTLDDFLLECQKKIDADLIIIMTKQEELSLSNNISDTARYIINNSEIPVMSIRPKESKNITGPTIAF